MRCAGSLAVGAAGTLLALSLASTAPCAADLKVVVTIKPLHALVAQVMSGVGAPELLVKGASSPHGYTLKPSEARALNADLFFRMSETVGAFTVGVGRCPSVSVVTLQDAPGMMLLAANGSDPAG
jgi:zinc transport system substrate-binding protein